MLSQAQLDGREHKEQSFFNNTTVMQLSLPFYILGIQQLQLIGSWILNILLAEAIY